MGHCLANLWKKERRWKSSRSLTFFTAHHSASVSCFRLRLPDWSKIKSAAWLIFYFLCFWCYDEPLVQPGRIVQIRNAVTMTTCFFFKTLYRDLKQAVNSLWLLIRIKAPCSNLTAICLLIWAYMEVLCFNFLGFSCFCLVCPLPPPFFLFLQIIIIFSSNLERIFSQVVGWSLRNSGLSLV